ncbi:thrombospondin type 3 repeat-containing protein [Shewanella sp. TC10]|uniref:thrombospondin type 3 repeat-containing protein n=1 Tax=Shewanella sp. TC10 TaxID=1419739 RepID=UPI00129D48E1|nr:thrombospondin type 3 repeat-containing protein [Shewanella sp. TC10]
MNISRMMFAGLVLAISAPAGANNLETHLSEELLASQDFSKKQGQYFSSKSSPTSHQITSFSSHIDSVANNKNQSEINANGLSFSAAEVADKNYVLLDDTREGYVPRGAAVFRFNSDGSGIAGFDEASWYDEDSLNWSVENGNLHITSIPRIKDESDWAPFENIARVYGQEIADHLIAKAEAGEISNNITYQEEVSFDATFEKLSTEGIVSRIKGTGSDDYKLFVPAEWDWNVATITSSEEFDFEENLYTTTNSLFSGESLESLSGQWLLDLFSDFFWLDDTNPQYGTFGERLTLNSDGSTSNVHSDKNFEWSMENGDLTLLNIDTNTKFVITPIIEAGKAFFASVKQYEGLNLVRVFGSSVAKFDNTYNQFTDNMVTELPEIQLPGINLSYLDAWDGDKPQFDQVWGYKFLDDGTFYRGVGSTYDDDGNPNFYFGQKWDYSVVSNDVEATYNTTTTYRERHWEVVSVDSNGLALVFEYSYLGYDFDNDGVIVQEEIGNYIHPRMNSMQVLDLSLYPEAWESLPDDDGDGLNNYEEEEYGTSPTAADSDYDGVNDSDEISLGLNPLELDSDGDGFSDGFEIEQGSDPLSSSSTPASSSISFTDGELHNSTAVLLNETHDDLLPHSGITLDFNSSNAGTYGTGWLESFSTGEMAWSVINGQLQIDFNTPSLTSFNYYSYPFTEVGNLYGQDVADWLIEQHNLGNIYDTQIEEQIATGDSVFTKLGIVNNQLQLVHSTEQVKTLVFPDEWNWSGDLPTHSSLNEEVVTWESTINSLLVDTNEAELEGKWALFLQYDITYGAYRGGGESNGLYTEVVDLHSDNSVSSSMLGSMSTWQLQSDMLVLSDAERKITVTPFKKEGKTYLALYEVFENDVLQSVYTAKLAKFDNSYSTFIDNIATQLPEMYFSGINSHIPEQWDGEQLLLENVWGYQFREDGTMRRGIGGAVDYETNETFINLDQYQNWAYTINDNVLEMFIAGDSTVERVRTWDIISVDSSGLALVFERSIYNRDTNYDGVITEDERGGYFIAPRFNTLQLFDLAQYEDEWAALADDDMDGLNNYQEVDYGTDLYNSDTDFDGISDGVEVLAGLDPTDPSDASADNDGDGLTNAEEIALGTDVNNADSDMDGVSDYDEFLAGTDPLDANDTPTPVLSLMNIADINNDGYIDVLGYYQTDDSLYIETFSGSDYTPINNFEMLFDFESVTLHLLADNNGNGSNELGIFGYETSTNKYKLHVYDTSSGNRLSIFTWPAVLGDVTFQSLDDLTGDSVEEYAISGVHLSNGTKQLVVKDGATRASYQTFKWPNLWTDTQFVTMSDITFDGVPEVALYGRHTRLDKGQLFIYDGADSSSKVDVYNWNKLWSNIQLIKMDDVDGDGTIDWGQFGQRKDDGRYQWLIKKGHDKRGVIRTFSWPNDLTDVKPLLVADRTGDNLRDVAVFGENPDNGKVFLRINDGKLANTRIANFSWPANWNNVQVVELGDLNADNFNEFALIGFNNANGNVQLVVKNGLDTTELGRYTLAGHWRDISVTSYEDLGSQVVAIKGVDEDSLSSVVTLLDSTLEFIESYTIQ